MSHSPWWPIDESKSAGYSITVVILEEGFLKSIWMLILTEAPLPC